MTRQQSSLAIAALLTTPFLLACPGFGDEEVGAIPANPTYIVDVKPILDASCVPCHTVPPQAGAPAGIRLDQYENDAAGNGGVYVNRETIRVRVVEFQDMPPSSRPDLEVTPRDAAIIDRWVIQGGPKTVNTSG